MPMVILVKERNDEVLRPMKRNLEIWSDKNYLENSLIGKVTIIKHYKKLPQAEIVKTSLLSLKNWQKKDSDDYH